MRCAGRGHGDPTGGKATGGGGEGVGRLLLFLLLGLVVQNAPAHLAVGGRFGFWQRLFPGLSLQAVTFVLYLGQAAQQPSRA